jgi:TolB-like protein
LRAIRRLFTKVKSIDIKRVARELGVRYVLEGSVRKGGKPPAQSPLS